MSTEQKSTVDKYVCVMCEEDMISIIIDNNLSIVLPRATVHSILQLI